MNDKLFPTRPILAVSAAVFRQGRVLLIRRAQAPLIGHFSLPGGRVELGETLHAAVARELMEEVGIEVEIVGFNRHVEAIHPENDRIRTHFVIASFAARWKSGEPRLSDEVDAVDWIDPSGPLPSPTTPELGEVLASAARIERQRGTQAGERAPFSLREKDEVASRHRFMANSSAVGPSSGAPGHLLLEGEGVRLASTSSPRTKKLGTRRALRAISARRRRRAFPPPFALSTSLDRRA